MLNNLTLDAEMFIEKKEIISKNSQHVIGVLLRTRAMCFFPGIYSTVITFLIA